MISENLLKKTLVPRQSQADKIDDILALKLLKFEILKPLRVLKNSWWESKASELQIASDSKNTKEVYNLLKQVYGPSKSSFSSISSKDGSQLFRKPNEIRKR